MREPMSSRTWRHAASGASLLALCAAGCTKYVPVTAPAPAPAPDRTVRLSFAPPRTVALVSPIGARSERMEVSEIVGELARLTDDSIVVVVRSTRGRGVYGDPEPGTVAAVARGPGVAVTERVPDREGTVKAVIITVGVTALVIGLLYAALTAYGEAIMD
jgi:hypothetical protein